MQFSFFLRSKQALNELRNTLEQLNAVINWHIFTSVLNQAITRIDNPNGGRANIGKIKYFS